MVREHVGEYSPFSHRDALSPSEIIFGDNCIGHFVVVVHKVSDGCAEVVVITDLTRALPKCDLNPARLSRTFPPPTYPLPLGEGKPSRQRAKIIRAKQFHYLKSILHRAEY